MSANRKRKILVVEDDKECAESYEMLLDAPDREIRSVHIGSDALNLLTSGQRFDLVVLDIMMPSGSLIKTQDHGLSTGVELTRLLAESGANVPTLVITARWEEDMLEALRQNGVSDILFKPTDPELVIARVNELLEEQGV
jgi:CheY-like chemotaxis protein